MQPRKKPTTPKEIAQKTKNARKGGLARKRSFGSGITLRQPEFPRTQHGN